jgi:hypothetical protein
VLLYPHLELVQRLRRVFGVRDVFRRRHTTLVSIRAETLQFSATSSNGVPGAAGRSAVMQHDFPRSSAPPGRRFSRSGKVSLSCVKRRLTNMSITRHSGGGIS